jgi:glycosyltransferase involved in cell wall biosynthesis
MKLLRCIRSLDPALGGVQEGVRQSCLGLPEMGLSVEVVCLDKPDALWLRDYPARIHALGPPKLGSRAVSVEPWGYSRHFVRWMQAHAKEYDAVTVEGVWQFAGWGTWLAIRQSTIPYFVITHSQLDPWYNSEYPTKHIKKQLYWLLVQHRVMRDARAIIYYNERERVLARKAFWPYRVNDETFVGLPVGGPTKDSQRQLGLFFEMFPELRDRRLVLFLGRIDRKKGCDILIDAFAQVARTDKALHLVLAGPYQMGWQQELREKVVDLGLDTKVTWTGMLLGDAKWGALHAAEVFVLPSHTEGYPAAMVEAMACGVPVLISDKVNIWSEVEATGGALVARDDLDGTTELLHRWLQLTPEERRNMALKAREGYTTQFSRAATLKRLVSVLQSFEDRESRS